MENDEIEVLLESIKVLREKNGDTLKFLAREIGINYTALFKMEKGQQKMDLDVLLKVAKFYGVTVSELLGRNDMKENVPFSTIAKSNVNELEINNSLLYILENYEAAKNENLRDNPMGEFVRHEIVKTITTETILNQKKYLVVGSVGQGQWATVPWVSCYDRSITRSATLGYYLVYLFKADMSGVYISLNQGWTYFKEKYGTKEGRNKIKKIANLVREQLNTVPIQLRNEEIDLATNNDLGKGYEQGHIYGRYYDLNDMPESEEIVTDFQSLLVAYQEIVNLINGRSVKQFNDYLLLVDDEEFLENVESEEEKYQDTVNDLAVEGFTNSSKDDEGPRSRKEPVVDKGGRERWPRSASEAVSALIESDYKCSINENHRTFTSKTTDKPFMELHHLVPMALQSHFINDLDRVVNIKSLCPNCHRAIHHGTDDMKAEMVGMLYRKSRDELESKGIEITLSHLKSAYGVEN